MDDTLIFIQYFAIHPATQKRAKQKKEIRLDHSGISSKSISIMMRFLDHSALIQSLEMMAKNGKLNIQLVFTPFWRSLVLRVHFQFWKKMFSFKNTSNGLTKSKKKQMILLKVLSQMKMQN